MVVREAEISPKITIGGFQKMAAFYQVSKSTIGHHVHANKHDTITEHVKVTQQQYWIHPPFAVKTVSILWIPQDVGKIPSRFWSMWA